MKRHVAGALTLALAVAVSGPRPVIAQSSGPPPIPISVVQPAPGSAIDLTTTYYDNVRETLDVQVTVGIPLGRAGEFTVYINGAAASGNQQAYDAEIPIGPNFWPARLDRAPYKSWFLDEDRLLLPILVEVVENATELVVARNRTLFFDLRKQDDVEIDSSRGGIDDGLQFQLTEQGLDELERTHLRTLPHPSITDFNSRLAENVEGIVEVVQTPKYDGSSPTNQLPVGPDGEDGCFQLSRDDIALLGSDAYKRAKSAADTQWGTWLALDFISKNASLPGIALAAELAKNGLCVDNPPKPKHFEFCVGSVEGELQSATVASVDSVDLAFSATPKQLEALVETGRVDGSVDGSLRDFYVRYTEGGPLCGPRPEGTMDTKEIAQDTDLNAWATCPNMPVEAISAATQLQLPNQPVIDRPEIFDVSAQLDSSETMEVGKVADGQWHLFDASHDAARGTCGSEFIHYFADEVLSGFVHEITLGLNATWAEPAPGGHQTEALDELFSSLEIGRERPAEYSVALPFSMLNANEALDDIFPEGMYGKWHSDATLDATLEAPAGISGWVYAPSPGHQPREEAFGPGGAPFDFAYTVTTGALNQVLREYGDSSYLNTKIEPDWDDLGLTPGDFGYDPTQPPPLNGTTLAELHPEFAALGTKTVEMSVRPRVAPFTWINPDINGIPTCEYDVAYHLPNYVVELVDTTGERWLTMYFDFFDGDLQLELDPTPGKSRLVAALGDVSTHVEAVSWQFDNCLAPPQGNMTDEETPSCQREMINSLMPLLEDTIEPLMVQFLSDYPAPSYWDANGHTSAPVSTFQVARCQRQNAITLYSTFE